MQSKRMGGRVSKDCSPSYSLLTAKQSVSQTQGQGSDFPMEALQLSIFDVKSDRSIYYWCLNDKCFYVDTRIKLNDISWREVWNSDVHDLDMVPYCPSCNEPLWGDRG